MPFPAATHNMPPFLARLLRPFTSTSSLSAASADGTGSAVGAAIKSPPGAGVLTVAAGCFWGVEHMYRRAFAGKGLYDARVGYCGGDVKSPSYRSVCSGRTGHAEALQVTYDPTAVSYRELLEFFYKMHDPTTKDRQGPDVGSQYRSAIFYHDAAQEAEARKVTALVGAQWYRGKGEIATQILPAGEWWDAEAYHQKYLDVNPGGYECPSHFLRKFPPLQE